MHIDLVVLQEASDTSGQLLDDVRLPSDQLFSIDTDIAHRDPHLFCLADLLDEFAGGDESFAGDTTNVQTDAPEFSSFYDRCFATELGTTDRADVTRWTGSDDDDIIFHGFPRWLFGLRLCWFGGGTHSSMALS